jgi:hypothetical protein
MPAYQSLEGGLILLQDIAFPQVGIRHTRKVLTGQDATKLPNNPIQLCCSHFKRSDSEDCLHSILGGEKGFVPLFWLSCGFESLEGFEPQPECL